MFTAIGIVISHVHCYWHRDQSCSLLLLSGSVMFTAIGIGISHVHCYRYRNQPCSLLSVSAMFTAAVGARISCVYCYRYHSCSLLSLSPCMILLVSVSGNLSHPLLLGVATTGEGRPELQLFLWGYFSSCPPYFFSCALFSAYLFLPSICIVAFLQLPCAFVGENTGARVPP